MKENIEMDKKMENEKNIKMENYREIKENNKDC